MQTRRIRIVAALGIAALVATAAACDPYVYGDVAYSGYSTPYYGSGYGYGYPSYGVGIYPRVYGGGPYYGGVRGWGGGYHGGYHGGWGGGYHGGGYHGGGGGFHGGGGGYHGGGGHH